MNCRNKQCRHVDAVHDELGCTMLGCPCDRFEEHFTDQRGRDGAHAAREEDEPLVMAASAR